MEVTARKSNSPSKIRPAVRWIAITSLAAATLVIVLRTMFSEERVLALIDWVASQGALAPVLFVIVQCLFIMTLAPGFILSFAAGFLFGFLPGLLAVWTGTVLGSVAAFTLAPLAFRRKSDRFLQRFPQIQRLDHGFSCDGWKIVMLRCLVPFFPFKLSNYAFGLTRVSIAQFTLGTGLGILPIGAFNVYLGSISADLSTIGARTTPSSPIEWAGVALGGVAIVATLLFVTRRAQEIFRISTEQKESTCG